MKWRFSGGCLFHYLLNPAEDSMPPHYFEFSLVTFDGLAWPVLAYELAASFWL